jgi:hypothetical protein
MTLTAEHGPAHLRLERHLVMLAAVVANYLELLRRILAVCGLFRAALLATLRGCHVALVEHLLVFFSEQEALLALDTYGLYIGHLRLSLLGALYVDL